MCENKFEDLILISNLASLRFFSYFRCSGQKLNYRSLGWGEVRREEQREIGLCLL